MVISHCSCIRHLYQIRDQQICRQMWRQSSFQNAAASGTYVKSQPNRSVNKCGCNGHFTMQLHLAIVSNHSPTCIWHLCQITARQICKQMRRQSSFHTAATSGTCVKSQLDRSVNKSGDNGLSHCSSIWHLCQITARQICKQMWRQCSFHTAAASGSCVKSQLDRSVNKYEDNHHFTLQLYLELVSNHNLTDQKTNVETMVISHCSCIWHLCQITARQICKQMWRKCSFHTAAAAAASGTCVKSQLDRSVNKCGDNCHFTLQLHLALLSNHSSTDM